MKLIQFLTKSYIGTFLYLFILLLSAGRLNYWQGWLYIILTILINTISILLVKDDISLLEERFKPGKGIKSWDIKLFTITFLLLISSFIIAGLDSGRYYWSPKLPGYINCLGIILTIGGNVIFLIAEKQNQYFSSFVRIQSERGHTVCESGLYSIIRHPGYSGIIISYIGLPLLFNSLWMFIPMILSIIILLFRTKLEDETLTKELKGYDLYKEKIRFKLIPGIW